MYHDHFGFEQDPFNITPDSAFLFPSRRHREAMAALMYGIEQRKGFIALTGEIGSGKTTICRALLKELDRDSVRVALILNPQLNDLELLQAINAEYGIDATSESKRALLDALNKHLLEQYEHDRNCVLIIDESQRLSPDALEQIRLISNLELESTKLIQIALVGQPELDDLLHLPELEQLNQRIMVRYHIDPLSQDEMAEYIEHRLAVANPDHKVAFHKKALRAIFDHTGGVPRRVNVLCDRALLVTFVANAFEVTEDRARQAISETTSRRAAKRNSRSTEEVRRTLGATSVRGSDVFLPPGAPSPPEPKEEKTTSHGSVIILAGCLIVAAAMVYAALQFSPPADRRVSTDESTASGGGVAPVIEVAQQPPLEPATEPTPPAAATTPSPTPLPTPVPTPRPLNFQASPSPTPVATAPPVAEVASAVAPVPPADPAENPAIPTEAIEQPVEVSASEPVPEPAPQDSLPGESKPQPTPAPGAEEPPVEIVQETPAAEALEVTSPVDLAEAPSPVEPVAVEEAAPSWFYDDTDLLRVTLPEHTYAASVLTWVSLTQEQKLEAAELGNLRAMDAATITSLEITKGAPPLHLREARVPGVLEILPPEHFPVLIQVDRRATAYGPWALLIERIEGEAILADPIRGRILVSEEELADSLASVLILFADPEGITDLAPTDSGVRVQALQRRLAALGLLDMPPTGVFDGRTRRALEDYRRFKQLPGGLEVDPLLAVSLIGDTSS